MRKKEQVNKKKIMWLLLPLLILVLGSGCRQENAAAESIGLIQMIEGYKGYTRKISQEEYDFYAYFVTRELPEEISPKELERRIRDYANEVNAVFYLGNQLNLCEPYSLELLQMRMEQENDSRRLKQERKEVIYGLEEFTLETYFQYEMARLTVNIQTFLEEHLDEEILKQAQIYYAAHPEAFQKRETVIYELTINGKTRKQAADLHKLSLMGKADKGLADFLEGAEPGDIYEDEQNGERRKIELKEIQYSEPGFAQNKEAAVSAYLTQKLYPSLIETVAENNPVEFE